MVFVGLALVFLFAAVGVAFVMFSGNTGMHIPPPPPFKNNNDNDIH